MTRLNFLLAFTAFVVVLVAFAAFRQPPEGQVALKLPSGKTLWVEVANTPEARGEGLSNRDTIGSDGMLFPMGSDGEWMFWMKNTRFALDLIWLDDRRVVYIIENAPPEGSEPRTIYRNEKPADTVLEFPAGTVAREKLELGDILEF